MMLFIESIVGIVLFTLIIVPMDLKYTLTGRISFGLLSHGMTL